METPARAARHPIHPMLVPLPIGLWTFSLVADLLVASGRMPTVWRDMAFWTMAAGIVGALLAALPGLVDYLSLRDPAAKRIGTVHLAINLAIVTTYAVNLWLRYRGIGDPRLPFALSIIGVAALMISGWLGGELVYHLGVAVDRRPDVRRVDAAHTP